MWWGVATSKVGDGWLCNFSVFLGVICLYFCYNFWGFSYLLPMLCVVPLIHVVVLSWLLPNNLCMGSMLLVLPTVCCCGGAAIILCVVTLWGILSVCLYCM